MVMLLLLFEVPSGSIKIIYSEMKDWSDSSVFSLQYIVFVEMAMGIVKEYMFLYKFLD